MEKNGNENYKFILLTNKTEISSVLDERDEDLAEEQEDLSLQLERFRPHLGNPIEVVVSRVSESEALKTEDVARAGSTHFVRL